MGEILVAQGKRRRSVAPGMNEGEKTVRVKMIFKEPFFGQDGTESACKNEVK
ncbi:MAG: hypothetical protein PHI28_11260 [Mangrovibacterium sp.]|nr:hypothetical protein [Mangrovibacterium sp.]